MRTRSLYDVAALLARLGVGVIFIAHGWRKLQAGIDATGRSFHHMGIPGATPTAVYSTFAELLGGAALIVGIGLPVAGILLFIDMAIAFAFVNGKHGLFLIDGGRIHNGSELVIALGLAALLFAAGGGGRFSLDGLLFRRRPISPTTPIPAKPASPVIASPGGTVSEESPKQTASAVTVTTSRDVLVAGKSTEDSPKTTPAEEEEFWKRSP